MGWGHGILSPGLLEASQLAAAFLLFLGIGLRAQLEKARWAG